jgi:hypothetical protein
VDAVIVRSAVILVATAVAMTGYALVDRGGSPTAPARMVELTHGRLEAAATNVETWHRFNDTYAGAPTGLENVTLVRADALTYCLRDDELHLAGPGGTVAPGPCP